MNTISHIDKLTKLISRLPSIGDRSALRMAMYLLNTDREYVKDLAMTLDTLHDNIKVCKVCNGLSEGEVCSICSNDNRNHRHICVVENYLDMLAIERSNEFAGVFHILNGLINPLRGVGINDIAIDSLINRVKNNGIEEITFAFSPSLEADTTTSYIYKKLKSIGYENKISRITYGISLGSDIENADSRTLARSIVDRTFF